MSSKINLKSIKCSLNPMIPAPDQRPRCSHKGCTRPKAIIQTLKDGSPSYRKVCQYHHSKNIARRNGVRYAKELTAQRQGLTMTEYGNRFHPSRRHRKDYCENKDGRLGFTCTTTIAWDGMLDVDHIDGHPFHNDPSNLQTLCKCCHAYKTNSHGDYQTPGRKKLKLTKA